jgi:intracellular multiplication protein IcmK
MKKRTLTIFCLATLFVWHVAMAKIIGEAIGTALMLRQVKQLQKQELAAQHAQMEEQKNQYLQGQLYKGRLPMAASDAPASEPTSNFKAPFARKQIASSPVVRSVQQDAFASTVQSVLPMTPDQIHRLRQLYTASQYAAAAPPGVPPRPTATSLFVDLSPGATPPAINLAEGDITALVFLDSTGAPWPIAAIDNGNPNAFNIEWNKKDNVLMIQAVASFGRGNLAVRLNDLGPPVMISLITNTTVENGGVVDYRVDMRVPGYGPNAHPATAIGLPGQTSAALLDVLDGIPPTGSKELQLSESIGQAWILSGKIYLRTRLTLLSPGWLQTMSSADGTNAYKLQEAPLLLMSQNGKIIQVKIEGL